MSILTLYSFIPILFSFNNIEKLYFYGTIPYIILCFTFFFLFYLSVFLVNPILNIQKTLKEIGNGNINIKINLFGKNCAGKLIPEIIKMQESIINIIQQISYTNSNISEDISNIVHENKNLKIKTENESKHITSMTIITEKVNNAFYKNNELSIEARTIIDNAIVSLNNGKKIWILW
jgi:methyl-accepting chemotaxis protein